MEVVSFIPSQCHCGSKTIILTSRTKKNPGRRFYRCGDTFGPGHTFRWVDKATTEKLGPLAQNKPPLHKTSLRLNNIFLSSRTTSARIVNVLESIRSMI
ncbi:hypothetical protein N665_2242s0004 [Sinapis alba]|nr:hypothetical protein N665_2242s0004 [Sinapis alba]